MVVYFILDTLASLATGYGLRWYVNRQPIKTELSVDPVAPAVVQSAQPKSEIPAIIQWLGSFAGKSEVSLRREASLLLTDLKSKV